MRLRPSGRATLLVLTQWLINGAKDFASLRFDDPFMVLIILTVNVSFEHVPVPSLAMEVIADNKLGANLTLSGLGGVDDFTL